MTRTYRLYLCGRDGRLSVSNTFFCDDDAEAIAWVSMEANGRAMELWHGARKVLAFGIGDFMQGSAAQATG